MTKRNRSITSEIIQKRINDGYGQGELAEFKPWLLIQLVASEGLVTRILGNKTKRVHHLLSQLELAYFYILDLARSTHDIQEQIALLPWEETLMIAETFGIPHPKDPKTKEFIVMTTDFLVVLRRPDGSFVKFARSVKPINKLASRRVQEKAEIERRFWQTRDIDWRFVTEAEIPAILAKNCELLHGYLDISGLVSNEEIQTITEVLTAKMRQPDVTLQFTTASCDKQLGLQPGISLSVAFHLIATRTWNIDLNVPLEPRKPLAFLSDDSGNNGGF